MEVVHHEEIIGQVFGWCFMWGFGKRNILLDLVMNYNGSISLITILGCGYMGNVLSVPVKICINPGLRNGETGGGEVEEKLLM